MVAVVLRGNGTSWCSRHCGGDPIYKYIGIGRGVTQAPLPLPLTIYNRESVKVKKWEMTKMDLRFCFRIAAAAKMARDENGKPADAFVQVKLGDAKRSPVDYRDTHCKIGNSLADQFRIESSLVIPISAEEYDRETEDDEEDCPHGDGWDDCPDCRH